ncbi:DUF6884 domain-containing protein [Bacillus toyonensis]|uniref:DUF6884 domain-containing protein n=1 Tax=Bacillus toyonensis TaxID=155322 RepID=UPI00352BB457
MRIALISCAKLKESIPCEAEKMYQKSTLFSKTVKYVEQNNYNSWLFFMLRTNFCYIEVCINR